MSHLNCPVCRAPFQEVVKEGIMIDICGQCRGVWLDRGELEKLMSLARNDRLSDHGNNQQAPNNRTHYQSDYRDQHRNNEERDHDRYDRRKRYGDDDDDDDDYGRRHGGFQRQSRFQRFFDIFD